LILGSVGLVEDLREKKKVSKKILCTQACTGFYKLEEKKKQKTKKQKQNNNNINNKNRKQKKKQNAQLKVNIMKKLPTYRNQFIHC
jgi:hypothetical protein